MGITRSRLYYEPVPEPPETKLIMDTLDEIYMLHPFFGVRRMKDELNDRGLEIGIYRTRSLLRDMGLTAVFPKPNTSRPHPLHPVYPYLLRDVEVRRNNQVWSADITYIKLSRGWAYLVAILDWHSRYVLSWRLSNTLDAGFCVEALEDALARHEKPDIFNTDQGCQFTSQDFTGVLIREGISISMDGRGRALDNVFIERLWRSVKYEDVYLHGYQTIAEARLGLTRYFEFYNKERRHQSLDRRTPYDVYFNGRCTEHAPQLQNRMNHLSDATEMVLTN